MKIPELKTKVVATTERSSSSESEFEAPPPSAAGTTSHEANGNQSLRELFRAELSRKLESTRGEMATSYSLQQLLHSNTPTAVKLRNTNHPQRSNRKPDRQSFAAYFEEILVNPEFANAVFKSRKSPKIDKAFEGMVNMIGLVRQSALEANRQAYNQAQLAAIKSELSELDAAAKYTAITAAGVLTVASEIEHWRLGATDPRNPSETTLFQLPTTDSKLYFIDLGDPQVALQLALNHTDSVS